MTLFDVRAMANRYRRWIVIITVTILFYTLAGFLFAPWLLQRYLTHTLADNLQRPVQVTDVHFNPFLFKLQVNGLKLLDSDNTPLISFEQIRFDYEVLSMFRLEFGVEDFALEKPYIKLESDGKGSFTFLHMFSLRSDTQSVTDVEEKSPESESSTSIPAFWLKSFQVNNGVIDYRDATRAGGFQQVIDLPNLSIDDFYTRQSEHANRFVLEIDDRDAGTLHLDTSVKNLQPLHLTGNLAVQNFNFSPIWKWLMLPVNFHLQAPRLELATQFDLQLKESLELQTSAGSLILRDLAISDKATPDLAVIKLPVFSVSDLQMNLLQQSLEIGSIQASDGFLDVLLDKQGAVNMQTLFTPTAEAESAVVVPAPTPAPQQSVPLVEPAKPWEVLIHQVAVSNYTLQLRDEKPVEPFGITLSPLSISINEWRPLSPDKFAIQLRSGLIGKDIQQPGSLSVDVQLQLNPTVADVHLDLQQLALPLIQPYVHDIALADIAGGVAGAVMDIHFEAGDAQKLDVQGNANIQKLMVRERGKDHSLLSWNALDVTGLSYQLQDSALKISSIRLDKPDTGFVINPDGTNNVQKILLPQPAQKKSSEPLKIDIESIAIENANLGFSDLSMKPNFKVAMQQLSGSIDGLSSNPKSQASINLKGKVDRYAPVTIKGKVNPLAAKPSLDAHMAFSNLELTTFTPYSGTYAGFKIEQGQLSLDIDYKLVDNKIQGKNKIVMDQLQLGSPVESSKAVDLPLRLAIALLKDENGVIDLGFEVGGDLNDPQFSIGGIIWKVFSNMIMKVVTSPFNALSAMTGGADAEGIDQIVFEPGQDQIDEVSLKKLQTAAVMLSKRSSLRLNIQGNTLPEEDRPGIQDDRLVATLREGRDIPVEAFISPQAALENGDAYKAVERYYDKQGKEDLDDVQDRIEDEMKARGEKTDSNTLKLLAYEQGWKKLQGSIVVSDDDLHELAMRRAKQIKAVLVEKNHVAPERVFVLDANTDPAKASRTTSLILDAN